MNNQIKLTLGGKERELNFSTMGFIENLREVCGMDPLAFLGTLEDALKDPQQAFGYVEKIFHAGLITQCDVEDVDPDFDAKKVRRWVKSIEIDTGAEIIRACLTTVVEKLRGKRDESGEALAQTMEESPSRGTH